MVFAATNFDAPRQMPNYKNECADECDYKCKGKGCCLPCCAPNPCEDRYSASEICCKSRASVVTISSQWATTDRPVTTPVPVLADISFMRVQGSGAFVDICKRRYILTSSALVQIPPSVLAANNRYPLSGVENVDTLSPTDIVAASRILVTVRDLNGRTRPAKKSEDGHTFVYEASPAFVDGAGGWALLYIDMCKEWNRCLPHIDDCHPCFKLGKSRKLNCGDPIYLLGDWGSGPSSDRYNSTGFGMTCGVVAKHRAVDHSGWAPAELVWGDFEAYHSTLGCPIVNQYCELVAVQYSNVPGVVDQTSIALSSAFPVVGSGAVAGISTFFMEYGLKCFSVIGSRKRKYDCYRRHLASVIDQYHGDYYKYLKGFIGIAYQLVEASDYNTRLGFGGTGVRVPLLQDAASGGLYDGPSQKNLAGIRVENVAGSTATTYAADGTAVTYVAVAGLNGVLAPFAGPVSPFNLLNVDSNFLTSLYPETIITAGEECYFGDESKQIAPGLLTWKYIAGDRANFVVRRPAFDGTNNLVPTDLHLRDSNSVTGALLVFPPDYDYPWACINSIPLPLSVHVDPIGVAPLFPPVMAPTGFKAAI